MKHTRWPRLSPYNTRLIPRLERHVEVMSDIIENSVVNSACVTLSNWATCPTIEAATAAVKAVLHRRGAASTPASIVGPYADAVRAHWYRENTARKERFVLHTPGLRPYTLGRGTTEAQATGIATLSATRHGVNVRVTRGDRLVAVCEPRKA